MRKKNMEGLKILFPAARQIWRKKILHFPRVSFGAKKLYISTYVVNTKKKNTLVSEYATMCQSLKRTSETI